ncbi:MAG: DUF541 domain-containing protein [Dehalococcoidia bacterium]|nr:DUF541 domain-containing protein [Dehalococcoidia bacterium]
MQSLASRRWIPIVAIASITAVLVAACSDGNEPSSSNINGISNAAMTSLDVQRLALGSSQQVGISVNGNGAVNAAPDIAIVSLGVETRADTVSAARSQAATAMTAILASLKASDVADKDVQTTSFTIQPVTVYEERTINGIRQSTPRIVGYRVTNNVQAKVRALDKVGAAVDGAAAAGGDATRVNSISFSLDDQKPLEATARELAVKDALAKAQALARTAGVKLGAAISIVEYSATPVVQREALAFAAPKAAGDAATPFSGGELAVRIQVQVVFSIG